MMAYYVLPDRKTVVEYTLAATRGIAATRDGIILALPDGSEGFVPESHVVNARLFAVHPDENDLCKRADDGTIIYRGEPLP